MDAARVRLALEMGLLHFEPSCFWPTQLKGASEVMIPIPRILLGCHVVAAMMMMNAAELCGWGCGKDVIGMGCSREVTARESRCERVLGARYGTAQ